MILTLLPAAAFADDMDDGIYFETVYGNNFDVPFTVAVSIENNAIAGIEIADVGGEWSEYDSTILDSAVNTMIPRILENQSLSVDMISGATASSAAIRYAVQLAIQEANGNPSDFFRSIAKSDAKEELSCDVVVVGLGAAGVSAFCSAAQNGASVIGIDTAAHVGGTSIVAGGPLAINPKNEMVKPYDEEGNELSVDEEAFLELWKSDTNAGEDGGAKAELIELMVGQSGEAVDWTIDSLGFAYYNSIPFSYPDLPVYACYDSFTITPAQAYIRALDNACALNEENRYLLEVTGEEILYNEDGSAAGVLAHAWDGTEYTIHAKSVILCTGGFAGSYDMQDEYIGYHIPLLGMYQNDGRMLRSAIANGAAIYNAGITPMTHNARTSIDLHFPDVAPAHQKALTMLSLSGSTLAVNMAGERFTNETDLMGLGESNTRANGSYYVIVDQNDLDVLREVGFDEFSYDFMVAYRDFSDPFYGLETASSYFLDMYDPITEIDDMMAFAVKSGVAFAAESVEKLAAQIGADALVDTVAAYNLASQNGEDNLFGKDAAFIHSIGVNGETVYAIKANGRCFTTVGGLEVNDNIEVLNTEGNVIPGLYACGTDSMGVLFSEESGYLDYGGVAHGWCFVSGRLAGENAAAYSAA